MKYTHRFRVEAPVEIVADFHRHASSLKAITPPPFVMQIHRAPARLEEGDVMDFTMWAGPAPIHWVASIEQVSPTGFVDRQITGPFKHWQHRHTFRPVDGHTTEVLDEVEAGMRRHPWWGPIGAGMWAGLPALFAYRERRTRRILEERMRVDAR
jgi:ligand-binding SRPBCC domain-containing protein